MDNTPLLLLVIDEPDTYAQGRKDTISVQISNPRKNDVKNVILSVSGNNTEITPSKTYIGKLASGASIIVNISVTPSQPTILALKVDYNNGDNVHSVTTSVPVIFSEDKKAGKPRPEQYRGNNYQRGLPCQRRCDQCRPSDGKRCYLNLADSCSTDRTRTGVT